MAIHNIYFYVFAALIAVNIVLAEETEDKDDRKFRFPFSSIGLTLNREAKASSNTSPDPINIPLLPNIAGCNYTAEPGWSCAGCTAVKVCLPNNVGINQNCGIFMPYCDNGRCSSSPSDSCRSSGSQ